MNEPKRDYIERALIKLKRQYSKDEVVSLLFKQISEKDFLIGQQQSEIDELKFELEKINKNTINKYAKIKARKDELYNNLLNINNKKIKEVRELTRLRDDLIAKNFALQKELNDKNN